MKTCAWAIVLMLGVGYGVESRSSAQASQQPWEWPVSTVAAEGGDAAAVAAFLARAHAGDFGNVNRIVIVRNARLVVDERIEHDYGALSRGVTSALGCGLDACGDPSLVHAWNYLHPDVHPYWRGGELHSQQSITKSVAATVIGVAIGRGDIAGVDVPLLPLLAAYHAPRRDPRLARATLRDLLTMRSGIEWHETDRPLDETNTTLQLERSRDWVGFTLAQPMDAEPGEKWVYNSGGSQLLAEVIRGATGEHLDRYAQRHLFGPLGVREVQWKRTPKGHPDTQGGLYLEPSDLARIGQLYLDDGVWNGRRILPAGWVREATSRHVHRVAETAAAPGYGYQWWHHEHRGMPVWSGRGFGGQLLLILPDVRTVAVVNSWNVFGARADSPAAALLDALLATAPETDRAPSRLP